ncbi:hypothetical protein L1987_77544 [Smallanthus sonchifolius]|uniref:Uncharacterized protein n=1 Tax=Smallanthus sonchifolius TaxID=185202 RepID=A0ACB8Z9X1_9ASTR|nr:hypothetical protein L1987_77544 [Smallanthus sonchifolius]
MVDEMCCVPGRFGLNHMDIKIANSLSCRRPQSSPPPSGPLKTDTANVEAVDYHRHCTNVDQLSGPVPFCISVFERIKRKVGEEDEGVVFAGEEIALASHVALEKGHVSLVLLASSLAPYWKKKGWVADMFL